MMTTLTLRNELQKQINKLPDEIVQEIADFTLFLMARRKIAPLYTDWDNTQWQDFSLSQFFRDEDEQIEYTLNDA